MANVKPNRRETGGSMAWFGVYLASIAALLLSLTIDIPRLGYVRVHLQAATDAACQAAADTLDTGIFQSSGRALIDRGRMYKQANSVFYSTLRDSSKINFSASFGLSLQDARTVECTASASVVPLLSVSPRLHTSAYTVSQMRVTRQP